MSFVPAKRAKMSSVPSIALHDGTQHPLTGFGTYKVGFIPASASASADSVIAERDPKDIIMVRPGSGCGYCCGCGAVVVAVVVAVLVGLGPSCGCSPGCAYFYVLCRDCGNGWLCHS